MSTGNIFHYLLLQLHIRMEEKKHPIYVLYDILINIIQLFLVENV